MTWSAPQRERIDAVITRFGRGGPDHDPAHPPVAVYDWDNTSMRGDVGDLALLEMLDRDLVRRPADFHAWGQLTSGALALLESACPGEAGAMLSTSSDGPCRSAIAQLAYGDALEDGSPAFDPSRTASYRASYGMMTRIFAGMTEAEATAVGHATVDRGTSAPVGTRTRVGTQEIDGFLRLQEPMHALADELRGAGFEVWIVSASFEPVVRVAAALAGFAPDHVIGTRLVLGDDGRYLAEHPFERTLGPILTFDEGKRFWIRHQIFGAPVEHAMEAPTEAADRPVLAAGDSDTDRSMLVDASALAILFDRGAPLVTCLSRAEPERFLVATHFVDPQPPRAVTCP
jgi:hypothetical protein